METDMEHLKRYAVILMFISGVFFNTVAEQTDAEFPGGDTVYTVVDKMPEPVGGMESIAKAVQYPELAKKAGIEGKVLVSFTVDETGKVTSASILKSDNQALNASAIEAVQKIAFKPGLQKGRKVKVKVSLPIVYKLDEKDRFVQNDEQAFPDGGMQALMSKIVYPEDAKKNAVQGKVLLKAIIAEDGSVEKAEVMKSVGYGCDEAALYALKNTKFMPAKKGGKPVRSEIVLPVMFKLQ